MKEGLAGRLGLCGIAGSHIYSWCCLLAYATLITGSRAVKLHVVLASQLSPSSLHQFCIVDTAHVQFLDRTCHIYNFTFCRHSSLDCLFKLLHATEDITCNSD